jgi:hypothetical protein
MKRRSVCLPLLLAIAGGMGAAHAGGPVDPPYKSEWMLLPAQPTTRTSVVLRNIASGCWPGAGARIVEIDQPTGFIDFYLDDRDEICTGDYHDDIEDTRLGFLHPGAYTIRFIECTVPYHPMFSQCLESAIPRLAFVVTDDGRPRQVIPAWSFVGAFATTFVLAGIALFRLKPR